MSLKPLRVEESAVGTGGLCGSAFLNYRFEEHVRNRLGAARFDEMKLRKGKTWQMGLKYFEEFVKRNFNEDEHQEVNVPYVMPNPGKSISRVLGSSLSDRQQLPGPARRRGRRS